MRTSGSYTLAKADSAADAEVIGVVQSATGSNFVIVYYGDITGLSGLTDAGVYFLSDVTAGLLTLTQPTAVGSVRKPIMVATGTATGNVCNWRGDVISANVAITSVTQPLTVTGAVLAISNYMGKNLCDNGAFVWDQRGAVTATGVVAATATQNYGLDRFFIRSTASSGTPTQAVSQQTLGAIGGTPPTNSLYCAKVVGNTNITDTLFGQRIEQKVLNAGLYQNGGYFSTWFFNGTGSSITGLNLVLLCPSTTADTFSGVTSTTTLALSAIGGTYTGSGTSFTVANGAWVQVGCAIAVANIANNKGLELVVDCGNTLGSTSNYVCFAQWQLELGSAATSFEVLPPAADLARCQRRYWKSIPQQTMSFGFFGTSSTQMLWPFSFPTTMASAPTILFSGTWGVSNASQPKLYGTAQTTGFVIEVDGTSVTAASCTSVDSGTQYVSASCDL
jgi:hypothetical protein